MLCAAWRAEADSPARGARLDISLPTVRPAKPHGPAHEVRTIKRFHSDKVMSETTYEYGEKNGPYRSYYDNGRVMEEGQYKDGLRDGAWKSYGSDGELEFTYSYALGLRNGERVQYGEGSGPAQGRRVIVERDHWVLGVKEGRAESFWNSGTPMNSGMFVGGQLEGVWTYFNNDGSTHTKTFVCGQDDVDSGAGAAPCPPVQITVSAPDIVLRPGETLEQWKRRAAPFPTGPQCPSPIIIGGQVFKAPCHFQIRTRSAVIGVRD